MREENNHWVQFYTDETFLTDAVRRFAIKGLQDGEAVVVAATAEHVESLTRSFQHAGFAAADFLASGQLTYVDAHAALHQITVHHWPDLRRFEQVLGGLIAEKTAKFGRLSLYGELVNVLWQGGFVRSAARLEEMWNGLLKKHRFRLFCGYKIDLLDPHSNSETLEEICHSHAQVACSEAHDQFGAAFRRAVTEILPETQSGMLHLFLKDQLAQNAAPDRGLFWLKRNLPELAGDVLARTRLYLGPRLEFQG